MDGGKSKVSVRLSRSPADTRLQSSLSELTISQGKMTASASQRAVQASAKKAAKAERKLQEADIGSKRSEMEKQKVSFRML